MRFQKRYSYRINENLLYKRMEELCLDWKDLDHLIGAQTGYMYQVMHTNKRVERKTILALAKVLSVDERKLSLDELYEEKMIQKPDMVPIDGEKLRKYADESEYTRGQLAKAMGFNNHDEINLAIGRGTCEYKNLIKIANFFCIEPSDLLLKANKEESDGGEKEHL